MKLREALLTPAKASVAQYPQYDDAHWERFGAVVVAVKRINGKGGLVMERGDYALLRTVRYPDETDQRYVTVWSPRRNVAVSINVRNVRLVKEPQA